MRAKNSNKSLLRASCLAFMFMLVVALAVGGFSFTRVSTRIESISLADKTNTPDSTSLDISVDKSSFVYSLPLVSSATTLTSFSWSPTTYNNFYFFIEYSTSGSSISGISRDTTSASFKPMLTKSHDLAMYAFYKLPDWMVKHGATIEIGSNISSAFSCSSVGSTQYSIALVGAPTSSPTHGSTGNITAKISSANQYIQVYYSGETNDASLQGSMTCKNLAFSFVVKSVNNYDNFIDEFIDDKQPVEVAWDGISDAPSKTSYGSYDNIVKIYKTNQNIAGGFDSWGLKGEDSNNPDTPTVLTSLRTDGTYQKQYSFMLYDRFFGLKDVKLMNFDLLSAYKGDSPLPLTTPVTYTRVNGYTTFPKGIKSISVEPYDIEASNIFRGLKVCVIYDGKSLKGDPLDVDTTYIVSYTNNFSVAGNKFTVIMGGLDYTAPSAFAEIGIVNDAKEYIEKDGKIWFYTNNVSLIPMYDDDSRGDVENYYQISYNATEGASYSVTQPFSVASINEIYTMNNLDPGYYKITYKAIDELGRYYEADPSSHNPNVSDASAIKFEKHVVTKDYEFIVDKNTGYTVPETWINKIGGNNNVTSGGSIYNGGWTNQNIIIQFNALNSIVPITMEYSTDNWATKNTLTLNSSNQFIIGYEDANPFGYERTYDFRATYASGKSYEFEQSVKFDNFSGYTPVSATLLQYTHDGIAYADILPLDIYVNYIYTLAGVEYLAEDFKGSPMTLYYSIDGVTDFLAVGENGEAVIDIFKGKNITASKKVNISMWFVDEAGNTSDISTYKVNIEPAKLYVDLEINDVTKKYYKADTTVVDGTVIYTIYKKVYLNGREQIINITDIEMEAVYSVEYAGKTAGKQNILLTNDVIVKAYSTTYKYLTDKDTQQLKEYQIVVLDNDDNVITKGEVVGSHEIRKARVTITNFPFEAVYNGTTLYAIPDYQDSSTLKLLDVDKTGNPDIDGVIENFEWIGNVRLTQGRDVGTNKKAVVTQDGLILKGKGSENYQITSASGEVENIAITGCTITQRGLTVVANDIYKVFDGKNTYNFTHNDYVLKGLQASDRVYLNIDKMKLVEFVDGKATVGSYTKEYPVEFDSKTIINYYIENVDVLFNINVTPKPITCSAEKTVVKTYDNDKDFSKQIAADSTLYSFKGIVSGFGNIKLVAKNGRTPSVLPNSDVYEDCPIEVSVGGEDGINYVIVDKYGVEISEMYFDVRINKLEISKAVIQGIYAIDENNNYYYIALDEYNNDVIYKKLSDGRYVAYDFEENETIVNELPENAKAIIIKELVNGGDLGGVITKNGQRLLLAKDIIYAIDYYDEDGDLVQLGYLDYSDKDIQPTVKQKNGNSFGVNLPAGTYTLAVKSFDTTGCFIKSTNFDDDYTTLVRIHDFKDAKFDGKVYNNGIATNGYSAIYSGDEITLDIANKNTYTVLKKKYLEIKDDGTLEKLTSAPRQAGTYVARFTVQKDGVTYDYVVEQEFRILSINTVITINKEDEVYVAKYGEDIASSLEGKQAFTIYDKNGKRVDLKSSEIAQWIRYEYSATIDFATILDGAPKNVAGDYYMRVVFEGDNHNYFGSTSNGRKIKITGVKFNAGDYYYSEDEEVALVKVSDVIDSYYKNFVNDFTVVYLIKDKYQTVTNPAKFATDGAYKYMIVHKNTIDDNGTYIGSSAGSEYLLAANVEGSSGVIYVSKSYLDSTYSVDNENAGELSNQGSISSNFLPITGSDEELVLNITDNTIGLAGNYTSGLIKNADTLGKQYQASGVYNIALNAIDGNDNVTTMSLRNSDTGVAGAATITLKANVNNGTKLFYYGSDSVFHEISYVNNGDGTITFTTNYLGNFIIADDYVPEKGDNALAIGLGVGLGAGIPIVLGLAIIIIKKKKRA